MAHIRIHQDKVAAPEALAALCPFGAIEIGKDNGLLINAGCRMCRMCVRKGGGVFEFVEDASAVPAVDKSQWRGIAVTAEIEHGTVHPVSLELLGKARELAAKCAMPVWCLLAGFGVEKLADELLAAGADEVFCYDYPELEHFRIEPYTAVLEDFIRKQHPSAVLVGGTATGRSLAPRAAARFHTGLTADCTFLDISENTDLDQIRPAYGGNIMAHINTPDHRPQFATVRYKIFAMSPKRKTGGTVHRCSIAPEKLFSAIEVLKSTEKTQEKGIEDAEVLVVAGRGVKKQEDLEMLRELAGLLHGQIAGTRGVIELGWLDPRCQIGLSGRTVKPKLILTCGVSGAIQFVAGMNHAEKIIAVNNDAEAGIFKTAHIGIIGDLYKVIPDLIERIRKNRTLEV